jgi:hypothetical protein
VAHIVTPSGKDYEVNARKDGDVYDSCPNPSCGQRDIDATHRFGGQDRKGETYQHWSIYHCDPRAQGCGSTWSRTTRQGQEWQRQRGQRPDKWPTASAARNAVTFLPTEAYRANYDNIRWDK